MRTVDLRVDLEDGVYIASGHEDFKGMHYSFVAEGADWAALKADVRDVVEVLYYDAPKPDRITLHLVHDDELMVA